MTLRAHELAWTDNLNVSLTLGTQIDTNKNCGWHLKEWFKSAGWEVTICCYGLNSSYTVQTSDIFAAYTDINTSTNSSWIVLRSPVGFCAGLDGSYLGDQSRIYMLLYFNGSTYVNISISRNAYTGGSYSTRPTSTKELYANTVFAPFTDWNFARVCFWQEPRGGVLVRGNNGNSSIYSSSINLLPGVQPLLITDTGFDYPFNFFAMLSNNQTSGQGSDSQANWTGTSAIKGYDLVGDPIPIYVEVMSPLGVGLTGKYETSSGGINGDISMSYMWLYAYSATYPCRFGRIPDLTITGAPIPAFTMDIETGNSWCQIGAILIPASTQLIG